MAEQVPTAIARILSLIAWIGDHPGAHVSEACERFGRTPKQLHHDILAFDNVRDAMPGSSFDFDYDLYLTESRLKIFTTMGVDVPPRLSPREAMAIIVGLAVLTPTLTPDLQARIPRTMLAIHTLAGKESATTPVLIPTSPAPRPAAAVQLLSVAIHEGKAVAFSYDSHDARRERVVDPWDLRLDAWGQWFLRAWCHDAGAERNFAVANMSDVQILRRKITNTPPTGAQGDTVTIRVTPQARWVAEEFSTVDARAVGDGFDLQIPVWNEAWFHALLIDVAPHLIDAPRDATAAAGAIAARALQTWRTVPPRDA